MRVLKRLVATVLIFEAVVVGLSIPVAIQISHLAPGPAGVAGGVAAGLAVLFAILARRLLPATLVGGSVLQIVVIVLGVVVPVMYFLGAVFALLWVLAIWVGLRVEHPASS